MVTNLARAVQGGEHEAPGVCGEGLRRVGADQEEAGDRDTLFQSVNMSIFNTQSGL